MTEILTSPPAEALVNFSEIALLAAASAGWVWPKLRDILGSFVYQFKIDRINRLNRERIEFSLFIDYNESMLTNYAYESSIVLIALMRYCVLALSLLFLLSASKDSPLAGILVTFGAGWALFIVSMRFSSRLKRFGRWKRALLDPQGEVDLINQELAELSDA